MTKVTQHNWTSYARKVLSAQSKIANELLEAAEPQDNGAVAGPQEVVDAIENIVAELEEVQEAIPAEPSMEEEAVVEAPEVEVEAEAPVVEEEEEKPIVAKLKAQVAALNSKVEAQEREKLAQSYPKVELQSSKVDLLTYRRLSWHLEQHQQAQSLEKQSSQHEEYL